MAKSITQNGITFSNYNNSEYLPFTRTIRLGTNEGLDEDNFGIINAVDISWDGAKLGSSTIHTTGELLSWIKTSLDSKQVSLSTTAVGTATNPVYWDGSKFVKTTYTLGKSVPSTAVFTDTVKTLPELVGTTAIGSATKPIYWNGSKFVTANNYPSGVSTLTLAKTGTSTIDLLANTTYTLTVGDKTLAFKTPADNTGSAADGNTWRPIYVGSTSVLTNNISSGNLKFDGGEQINPVWDSTNKVIKFNHYKTDGRSYGPNQTPGFYKFASDAWGHIIAGTAVTKADITALGIPAQDTVYTHPSYTAKSSGLYKITVDNKGHVSAATAVAKSDITALGIPAQDTVYTHPSYTAKSSGLYKITVDNKGHVTAATAVTASDLKSVIKDLLVAGDNITITENSAGKLVVSAASIQEATAVISSNTITRPKNSTLSSISWTGGSAPSTINSGSTGTLTKGTVTGTYGNSNGTATITTSGIIGDLNITSNNESIITIGTVVKNGDTTINGIKAGSATITVKDGTTLVKSFVVTVSNASNTSNVTSSATFSASAGSISGTTITAPTVTADTTVTITCTYGGKKASQTVTYTAKKVSTTTYYYYAGTTKPTALSQASTVTSYPTETTYTNNSGAKSHVFVLTNSNKSVTFIEPSLNAPITQKEVDTTTISGYKIFETAVGVANTGTVKIQIS